MLMLDVTFALTKSVSNSGFAIDSLGRSPPLLVFSISQLSIHIDTAFKIVVENSDHLYMLAAVIYYANSHFTAQIITHDGRVWFYDGMQIIDPNIQPTLEYVGTIHSQIDMRVCRGGEASALIYAASCLY